MSRIGKMPVSVPAGVEVKIGDGVIDVKGPNGHVSTPACDMLDYEMKDGAITLTRKDDSRESNAQHGLRRTLLNNCILGVTQGFKKSLEVVGVGYRVGVKGSTIELQVGYSHPVLLDVPEGRRRQGSHRRVRGPHPPRPPARALQGQGHQVHDRDHPPQGRQVWRQEVGSAS